MEAPQWGMFFFIYYPTALSNPYLKMIMELIKFLQSCLSLETKKNINSEIPKSWKQKVSCNWKTHSTRVQDLCIVLNRYSKSKSWESLGLFCPGLKTELTWQRNCSDTRSYCLVRSSCVLYGKWEERSKVTNRKSPPPGFSSHVRWSSLDFI